ncbi:MerR family transcriptional regulator [Pseudomonas sp. ML96]|uniref:MerR family transcriptional regulator n=1 Tax=Pseudomonadaceae TaxID=135621 RepID=UPI0005BB0824|nr:MerR family transcriptional regulator [Pseudomonas sp. ML96]
MSDTPLDYQSALALGYLPIREVARSTGVNPVTLRAWERRYGLVVPHRTAKGHRLYAPEQIERIQQVLTWLNRGVAVGQVRELLEQNVAPETVVSGVWDELRQAMLHSVARQAERSLDEAFNRAQALYPPSVLCAQLLLPLLAELDRRWRELPFGARLEQVFFHSWLRSKLGARLYHDNRQQAGAPLLLVSQSELELEPGLWLCAWLFNSAGCQVQVLDWAVPLNELVQAVDHIAPRALLLYSSQALVAPLRHQLARLLDACAVPLLLAGPAASIHAEELSQVQGLHLAADPLLAEQHLRELGLLEDASCAS